MKQKVLKMGLVVDDSIPVEKEVFFFLSFYHEFFFFFLSLLICTI